MFDLQKLSLRELANLSKQIDCVFRTKPATDSTTNRPPIPAETGHRFHVNPAT